MCLFHACSRSRFSMISWHAYGSVGSIIKNLVTIFHTYWDSVDFGFMFSCVFMASGNSCVTFGALKTAFKFDDLGWLFVQGGGTISKQHTQVVVIWLLLGPYCSNQTVWSSSSSCKMQRQTCRNKGMRKKQDAI